MLRIASIVLAGLLLVGGTAAAGSAKLALVDGDPIVVHGTGFRALERVKVTAYAREGPLVRRVLATTTGRFVARFRGLSVESCEAAVALVRAVGSRGSVAAVRLRLRECPAP